MTAVGRRSLEEMSHANEATEKYYDAVADARNPKMSVRMARAEGIESLNSFLIYC